MELENVMRELLKCYSFILERMVQIEENQKNQEQSLIGGKTPYLVDLWSARKNIYDPIEFGRDDLLDIGYIDPKKKEAFLEIYREMVNILVAGQMMTEDIQNRREVDIYSNIASDRWEYEEALEKNGISHSYGFFPIFQGVDEEQEDLEYDDDDDRYHDDWWANYWYEHPNGEETTKTGVDTNQSTKDISESPASKQLTVDPDGIQLDGKQKDKYNEILSRFTVIPRGKTSETTEFWQNCFEQISLQHSNAFEIFEEYAKLLIARSNYMAKNETQISEVINYTIYDELFKSLIQRIKSLKSKISSYVQMYNVDLSLENEASSFMKKLENADRSHVFVYYVPENIGNDGAKNSSDTSNDVIAIFDNRSNREAPIDLLPYHVFLEQGGDLRAIDYILHQREQGHITKIRNRFYDKIFFYGNPQKTTDRDIDLLKCSLVNDAIMFLRKNYNEGTDDINKLAQIYLGNTYSYLAPVVIERFLGPEEKEDSQESLIDRIREIESTRIKTTYNKINLNSFKESFPSNFIEKMDLWPIGLIGRLLEYYEKGHLEKHREGLEQRRTEQIKGMRNFQEDKICVNADTSKTAHTIAREIFNRYMKDMQQRYFTSRSFNSK